MWEYPEDIVDGIIEINIAIGGILPHDASCSIN